MLQKKSKEISQVFCLWEYLGEEDEIWSLVETYGADEYGYAVTPSRRALNERNSFSGWMTKKVVLKDPAEFEYQPVPGRLVTAWSMEHGVQLAAIHLPDQPIWLCGRMEDVLRENRAWIHILARAYAIFSGTAQVAERLLREWAEPATEMPKSKKKARAK